MTTTGLAQEVKMRPIIFGAESVRAILEGRKTQTRRVFKTSPFNLGRFPHRYPNGEWGIYFDRPTGGAHLHVGRCPYGQPGDRLWVRETWAIGRGTFDKRALGVAHLKAGNGARRPAIYRADGETLGGTHALDGMGAWRSPIFMPRWASRVILELTDVRVERVQEITPQDCIAEGVEPYSESGNGWRMGYQKTWDELNAKRSFGWTKNPWVWVLEFKRVAP